MTYIILYILWQGHFHRPGEAGRHSDGGILANSEFGNALEDGSLNIPDPCPLPGTTQPSLPHVIVADEAFPLKMYMLCPYPGRQLPGNDTVVFNLIY